MSNVSNIHNVVPFKAGDKALTGQRLAKVGYKTSKKNPAKYSSVAVSVPHISPADISANLSALMPYIGTMLENTQDAIIRSLYESKDGTLKTVHDDEISVSACIGYLSAEASGNRLTSEAIEKWFDSELSENLFAHVAVKLRYLSNDADASLTPEQETTVNKHVKVYKDVLSMLAGGKTMLAEKQIKGCKNALALVPDSGDQMAERLMARLNVMEKKATEEFLDL